MQSGAVQLRLVPCDYQASTSRVRYPDTDAWHLPSGIIDPAREIPPRVTGIISSGTSRPDLHALRSAPIRRENRIKDEPAVMAVLVTAIHVVVSKEGCGDVQPSQIVSRDKLLEPKIAPGIIRHEGFSRFAEGFDTPDLIRARKIMATVSTPAEQESRSIVGPGVSKHEVRASISAFGRPW